MDFIVKGNSFLWNLWQWKRDVLRPRLSRQIWVNLCFSHEPLHLLWGYNEFQVNLYESLNDIYKSENIYLSNYIHQYHHIYMYIISCIFSITPNGIIYFLSLYKKSKPIHMVFTAVIQLCLPVWPNLRDPVLNRRSTSSTQEAQFSTTKISFLYWYMPVI